MMLSDKAPATAVCKSASFFLEVKPAVLRCPDPPPAVSAPPAAGHRPGCTRQARRVLFRKRQRCACDLTMATEEPVVQPAAAVTATPCPGGKARAGAAGQPHYCSAQVHVVQPPPRVRTRQNWGFQPSSASGGGSDIDEGGDGAGGHGDPQQGVPVREELDGQPVGRLTQERRSSNAATSFPPFPPFVQGQTFADWRVGALPVMTSRLRAYLQREDGAVWESLAEADDFVTVFELCNELGLIEDFP